MELYQRPIMCVVFEIKSYIASNSIQRRPSYLGDSLKVWYYSAYGKGRRRTKYIKKIECEVIYTHAIDIDN